MIEKIYSHTGRLLNKLLPYSFFAFAGVYLLVTLSLWSKYDWNPTAMLNIGREFALQNRNMVPDNSVVQQGYEGDLGAGYDGQIFYFFSRAVNGDVPEWPKGFDESYRAPRIGYPFLVAIFGLAGKYGSVFGMYFLNLALLYISFLFLRELLPEKQKYLSLFYLLNPFALGSYAVLVSDSVMVSLVIIAYYLFVRERYLLFSVTAGLAILTKEPALFLLFPLGLETLLRRDWKRALVVASSLVYPVLWHTYLRYTFPNWTPSRLADFILPLEGITVYLSGLSAGGSLKGLARELSRLPLVVMFLVGLTAIFRGNKNSGAIFRVALLFTFFMIGTAGHYHFWSVYENISRMFTISVPLFIFLAVTEDNNWIRSYLLMVLLMLLLFIVKITMITRAQPYDIWS